MCEKKKKKDGHRERLDLVLIRSLGHSGQTWLRSEQERISNLDWEDKEHHKPLVGDQRGEP